MEKNVCTEDSCISVINFAFFDWSALQETDFSDKSNVQLDWTFKYYLSTICHHGFIHPF